MKVRKIKRVVKAYETPEDIANDMFWQARKQLDYSGWKNSYFEDGYIHKDDARRLRETYEALQMLKNERALPLEQRTQALLLCENYKRAINEADLLIYGLPKLPRKALLLG